jgi:hypothetical protein
MESETGIETVTAPVQDPFADPIIPPSTHPTVGSFRGRLVMIHPRKQETIPDNLNPGKMVERITADITVMDGRGPVPVVKGNPPQPTGQYLEGPDFTGVWIQSERIVTQLSAYVGTGKPVLGTIDTRNPGTNPMKGNPWGLNAASPEEKAHAVNFLNSRTVGAAAPPFQPQPTAPAAQAPQSQYAQAPFQPAPQQQYAAQAPQYAQPPFQPQAAPPPAAPAQVQAPSPQQQAPAAAPAPGPAANPFLQQAPAAAPAQPVNPFLQQAPQQ